MLKGVLPPKLLSFYAMVAGSLFFYTIGFAISFAASVFVTRHIGPQGQGQVASVFALVNIGIILARAGLGNVIKICVTQDARWVGGLFTRTSLVSLAASLLIIPLLYYGCARPEATPQDRAMLLTGLMFIPFIIISVNCADMLMGMHRSREYNTMFILEKSAFALASAAFVITGLITPLTALLCLCGSMALRIVPFWFYFRGSLTPHAIRAHPLPALDKRMIAVDFPASLCFAFAPNFMPLLLSHASGFAETGYYGVAQNLCNMLQVLPSLYASYAINKLVLEKHDRDYSATKLWLLGSILLCMTGAAVVFYAIGGWLVPFLFGAGFAPAVPGFRALLPSVVWVAGYQIINSILLAERRLVPFLSFALLFAALAGIMPFILAQPLDARGAALSYNVATCLVFLGAAGHFILTVKAQRSVAA